MDEKAITKERLLTDYPPSTRGLAAIALREHATIAVARGKGWQWRDIAIALGVHTDKARQLSDSYRNICRQVEAGKLTPPHIKGSNSSSDTNHTHPLPSNATKISSDNASHSTFDGTFEEI